ncbi:MAG: transglycosylase domain-containing protein [Proteobacteria bacterium]|jgi:hypothetical protein|nr:transglycosylase domain-containing protein [Pseudomonadota bacterium]
MGLKRWILALSIPVVVLGLLVALFFQIGTDERIIDFVIPKVEDRLGVKIEYEDVSVGLTAVVFDRVSVLAVEDGAPFARIGELSVNVRVGPLLIGDVDITGLRCDSLDLLLGEGLGASAQQWRRLLDELGGARGGGGAEEPAHGKVEIHVVSGSARAALEGFTASVGGFSGRLSDGGEAVLQVDGLSVSRGAARLLSSENNEIRYKPDGRRVSIAFEKPRATVPIDRKQLAEILGGARRSFEALGASLGGFAADGEREAEPDPAAARGEALSIRVLVNDGSAELVAAGGGENVVVEKISAELLAAHRELATCRATGNLPGTDARWGVSVAWPEGRPLVLDVEIPDLPLRDVGPLFYPARHVEYERAFADGTLHLEIDGRRLGISGQASLSGLGMRHERLDDEPIADLDASFDFKATYDRGARELRLERVLVSRGQSRVTFRGLVRLDRLAFDLSAHVPPTPCRQLLAAIPPELRREVDGVQLDGTIALDARLAVDEGKPADTVLDVALDNLCRIADFGPLPYPDDFRRPFAYTGYAPDGAPLRLVSGPGTERWANFAMISPYVVEAALTTEDGKFMGHKGVTLPEIQRAIELNLEKGRLSHGASTITMQLAKNLFLARDRTVSRKLEELFFTWYLESYFRKEEILELYLNVIEFGPSIYGIADAARHYFGREPHELNLAESVFLVKLLPSPVARHDAYEHGVVSERRMNALRKVMRTMFERNRISGAELELGFSETIDFHLDGEPLPEPRMQVPRGAPELTPDDGQTAEDESSETDWGF